MIAEVSNAVSNNEVDWIPGVGEVHRYEGAISTGPQHLTLDEPRPVRTHSTVKMKEELLPWQQCYGI